MVGVCDGSVPLYHISVARLHASPPFIAAGVSRALSDPVLYPDLGFHFGTRVRPALGCHDDVSVVSCLLFVRRPFSSILVPDDAMCPAGLALFIMQIFVKVRKPFSVALHNAHFDRRLRQL